MQAAASGCKTQNVIVKLDCRVAPIQCLIGDAAASLADDPTPPRPAPPYAVVTGLLMIAGAVRTVLCPQRHEVIVIGCTSTWVDMTFTVGPLITAASLGNHMRVLRLACGPFATGWSELGGLVAAY